MSTYLRISEETSESWKFLYFRAILQMICIGRYQNMIMRGYYNKEILPKMKMTMVEQHCQNKAHEKADFTLAWKYVEYQDFYTKCILWPESARLFWTKTRYHNTFQMDFGSWHWLQKCDMNYELSEYII